MPRTDIIVQTILRQHATPAVIIDGHLLETLKKTYRGEDFILHEDNDIIKGFDLVVAEFDDDADDLLDYFEKTWIGEPKRRGKIFLSISISILNLFLYRSQTKETTLRSQIMEHLRSCHR